MVTGRFVLENQKGEVVRTFTMDSDSIYLVYRHDTRRVEALASLRRLDEQRISYDLLKETTKGGVVKKPIALKNGATFRYLKKIERYTPSVQIADDSKEQEKTIYKYTAYTQLGIFLAIFIIGLLIEPLLMKKHEEEVVLVVPREFVQKKVVSTVKAAQHKIDPAKKVAAKKVESHTKEVIKTLTTKVKSTHKENAPLRTQVKVENVGALGVLGGMKNGSRNSSGFNTAATNNSRGTSWNGTGAGGVGGMERAIPGEGLVSSTVGQGAQIEGGGGYGTRGKAGGGRPGYGTMNMGGIAASYFEPIQEQALIEGGLEKDQIAAVIARHQGEVVYCYEKGLQVKPGLSGRINIRWVINGQGAVNSAMIESTSLKSAQVEGCIVDHLRTWRFPKPVGGVNVKVSYPFVLKRVNHG